MYDVTVEALLAAASGATLALLGVALIALGATQRGGRWFAIFAVQWGIVLVAANLARMAADADTRLFWGRTFLLLEIPLYFTLLRFITLHPRPWGAVTERRWFTALLAAPALLLWALFAVDPGLFLSLTVGPGGEQAATPGPLFGLVVDGSGGLLLVAALVLLGIRTLREPGEVTRRQLSMFVVAFALIVSYQAGRATQLATGSLSSGGAGLGVVDLFLLILTATLGALALVWTVLRVRAVMPEPWGALAAGAVVLPAFVSLVELALEQVMGARLETLGLWRVGMVAIFAYGLARYRLFDVELRLRPYLPLGVFVVATVVALDVTWNLLGPTFDGSPGVAVVSTIGIEVSLALIPGLAVRALLKRIRGKEGQAYITQRKREVYQAALEGAWSDQRITEHEDRFLADLRRQLGIPTAEHDRLLARLTA